MLDGLAVHIVLTMFLVVAAAAGVCWYLGVRVKSAGLWLVLCIMPVAVAGVVVYFVISLS